MLYLLLAFEICLSVYFKFKLTRSLTSLHANLSNYFMGFLHSDCYQYAFVFQVILYFDIFGTWDILDIWFSISQIAYFALIACSFDDFQLLLVIYTEYLHRSIFWSC